MSSNRNLPYNFFYTKERTKPLMSFQDDLLVERGPCRCCGIEKFMGRRNAIYCSDECTKQGKARAEVRSQARLKERREKLKEPTAPAQDVEPESFLHRRMREMEAAGKFQDLDI